MKSITCASKGLFSLRVIPYMGMKLYHPHRFNQASSGVIPYMGMKYKL